MGKLLTDAAIKAAIRDAKAGKKGAIILTDPAPKGAGRLAIKVRAGSAEWYAQRYVSGNRRLTKIGSYPDIGVAEARERFTAGASLAADRAAVAAANRGESPFSIRRMFDAYVASRGDAKPNTIRYLRDIFAYACEQIGGDRPAAEITPADIVKVIQPIYSRGARVNADKHRAYLGSAFRWAMRSTYDYRSEHHIDWGIKANPVDSVARDKEAAGVGTRWLRLDEYITYLAYMDDPRAAIEPIRNAIKLIMLTGQRAEEILRIRPEDWDSDARVITWEETKNGLAHAIPVCSRAAAILDGMKPGRGGWFFPNSGKDERPIRAHSLIAVHNRYTKRNGIERFTSRDLRRTWKTLSGEAGLSKEDRDRLQNHSRGDVSSVHYDRYSYIREKREAVAKWEAWIEAQIKKGR